MRVVIRPALKGVFENSGLSDFLTVILKKKPWKEKNVEVRLFQGKAYTLRVHNGDPPHLILMRSL